MADLSRFLDRAHCTLTLRNREDLTDTKDFYGNVVMEKVCVSGAEDASLGKGIERWYYFVSRSGAKTPIFSSGRKRVRVYESTSMHAFLSLSLPAEDYKRDCEHLAESEARRMAS